MTTHALDTAASAALARATGAIRAWAVTVIVGLAVACVVLVPQARAEGVLTPASESDAGIHGVCAPPTSGHASCLAMTLIPHEGAIPKGGAASPQAAEGPPYPPAQLSAAYGLPTEAPASQTVAVVDAYNDPNAKQDLETYENTFKLSACKETCFSQVGQTGESGSLPFPKTGKELPATWEEINNKYKGTKKEQEEALRDEEAIGWDLEISLDIETVRAICHNCHILLVEANSAEYSNLEAAERTAERLGANEISNSWGGSEEKVTNDTAFNDPGVVITAAAGDCGYRNWYKTSPCPNRPYTDFPASSPHVVAVGGTRLSINKANGAWEREVVWNGSGATGSGCSEVFEAPTWQNELSAWSGVGCAGKRAVGDVAADADPYTGVPVRDTGKPGVTLECETEGWCSAGGTSLASPLIASVFALAGGANGVEYPAQTLYQSEHNNPVALHDVTSGSNGACSAGINAQGESKCSESVEAASCGSKSICLAGSGYDGPTGVGTPNGIEAFKPGSGGGNSSSNNSGSSEPGKSEPSPPNTGTATPAAARPPTLRVTSLALTFKAITALNRSRPKASLLAFTFTITAPTRMRVTLMRRVRRHGHTTWIKLPDSMTIAAKAGRNGTRLSGRNTLATGTYRLTLTPVVRPPLVASARSLNFRIG